MSRTIKGSKGGGYEYWSKRPGNKGGSATPWTFTKKQTHSRERVAAKEALTHELKE